MHPGVFQSGLSSEATYQHHGRTGYGHNTCDPCAAGGSSLANPGDIEFSGYDNNEECLWHIT